MSNPARDLHTIFAAWRSAGSPSARPDKRGAAAEAQQLATSVDAMKYLAAVDATLDAWSRSDIDVSLSKKYITRWAKIILAYPLNWRVDAPVEDQFPRDVIDNLEMLANQFDLMEKLQPLVVTHIQGFVDSVEETLASDDSLDEDFCTYIRHLLDAVIAGLEHGDSATLREDLQHLWFAVFAAEEFTSNKGTWRKTAAEYGKATFVETVASIPGMIVQALTS